MGTRTQLGPWVFLGARACASLRRMSFRQILPLAVLVTALLPASALAAPTVTVTGDDGNPSPLNAAAPVEHPQHGRRRPTSPSHDRHALLHEPGPRRGRRRRRRRSAPAARPASDRPRRTSPTTAATGPTPWSCATTTPRRLRLHRRRDRAALPVHDQRRHRRRHPARPRCSRAPRTSSSRTPTSSPSASTPARRPTRSATPSAASPGPDGAISGPSAETFVDRTTGLADFRFDKPGRWLIVARAKSRRLLHAVERAGERQRDRAVRPRAHLVPRRPRAELQGARPGP